MRVGVLFEIFKLHPPPPFEGNFIRHFQKVRNIYKKLMGHPFSSIYYGI